VESRPKVTIIIIIECEMSVEGGEWGEEWKQREGEGIREGTGR
jgi:hypothetical protein